MNKVFVLVAVFAVGVLCGYQFFAASGDGVIVYRSSPEDDLLPTAAALTESPSVVATADAKATPEDLIKLLGAQTPKTQFEGYRAFQKLDQLSVDEIEQMLLSLDDSQLQLRGQIAWFLTGKFPDRALALMESSMGDNQMSLAQTLLANLTTNHPEQVFDWLQNNENDFAILFPVAEQQFERKMVLYQALSVFPDWKWSAYEAGMALVKNSIRPQDKWSSRRLAQTVAQANPQEAINYALAQHSGAVDGGLLNGALVEYAKTNPLEAKTLLLQYQLHADDITVGSLIDNLLFRGHFDEAYGLANSLQGKEIIESTISGTAGKMHNYGSEKVIEFVATIKDPALKVKAVSSATNSMSVAGYPVEKLLEVMDSGLRDVPVDDKAFSYAWTLKSGYKNDPQAMSAYMHRLKFNDKDLAAKVEEIFGYLKES